MDYTLDDDMKLMDEEQDTTPRQRASAREETQVAIRNAARSQRQAPSLLQMIIERCIC